MTRAEELTLKYADGVISEAEAAELEALISQDPQAAQACQALLELEGALRGIRQNLDVTSGAMARIKSALAADKIEKGAMDAIRRGKPVGRARIAGRKQSQRIAVLKRWFAVPALAAALVAAVTLFVFFRQHGSESHDVAVATINDGGGTVQRNGKEMVCAKDFKLNSNDALVTGKDARLSFRYDDGSEVEVNSDSELSLLDDGGAKRVTLSRGAIFVKAAKQPANLPWVIHTPAADARIVGTTFEIVVAEGKSTLRVGEGEVRFGNTDHQVSVAGGNASIAALGQAPSAPAGIARAEIATWRGQTAAPKVIAPAPPAAPAPARNLLTNPGFEDGEAGWKRDVAHPGVTSSHAVINAPVHSGARSLQMTIEKSEYGVSHQDVAIDGGATYSASGWMKAQAADDNIREMIIVLWVGQDGRLLNPATVADMKGSLDWTHVSLTVTAPPNAVKARFHLHAQSAREPQTSGSVWFDDLEFIHQ